MATTYFTIFSYHTDPLSLSCDVIVFVVNSLAKTQNQVSSIQYVFNTERGFCLPKTQKFYRKVGNRTGHCYKGMYIINNPAVAIVLDWHFQFLADGTGIDWGSVWSSAAVASLFQFNMFHIPGCSLDGLLLQQVVVPYFSSNNVCSFSSDPDTNTEEMRLNFWTILCKHL